MTRPEPTLSVMSVVCAAYHKLGCAGVCARSAKELAGQEVQFSGDDLAQLLSMASLTCAVYQSDDCGIPTAVWECLQEGSIVLVQMLPDSSHHYPWYTLLRGQDDIVVTLLGLNDVVGTRVYEEPIEHYITGTFVVVLERGNVEEGLEAAIASGILV